MGVFSEKKDLSKVYAFIDMSNLLAGWERWASAWFGPAIQIEWRSVFGSMRSGKYCVYDALEDEPRDDEEELSFNKRLKEQRERLKRAEEIDFVHVETGKLVPGRRGLRQKGVDVRLAIDCMEHAHRGNCNEVVLFSGDGDFTPLVRALVRNGITVRVIAWKKHYSDDLLLAADVSEVWDLDHAMQFVAPDPALRRRIAAVRDAYAVGMNNGMALDSSIMLSSGSYHYYRNNQGGGLMMGPDPATKRTFSLVGTKEEISDYWRIQYEEEVPWIDVGDAPGKG